MTSPYSTKGKKMTATTKQTPHPFHTIVVTSPDSQSAKAALHGPLHPSSLLDIFKTNECSTSQQHNDIHVYSTSDPFDTRMGSGGGTLAALDVADSNNKNIINHDNQKGSVLIIHAGGQSSRCPTQITLGKAWTSLPTVNDTITNPTYILLESLSKVLANLPSGSVVVAASDVLLSLPMDDPIDFDLYCGDRTSRNGYDKVLGIAVPAKLETAQNHGVFVIDDCNNYNSEVAIKAINAFLQKPTIQTMKEFSTESCVFQHENDEKAWIDTGVIIFLPRAAESLRTMMKERLNICTSTGLENMYNKLSDNIHNSHVGIEEFAKAKSTKIELYSHLLLAIPTKGSMEAMDDDQRLMQYLSNSMNQDLSSDLLSFIFNSFRKFELQVCIIPEGEFIHLGTTTELRKFLINGSSPMNMNKHLEKHHSHSFGNRIGLVKQSQATLHNVLSHPSSVVLNSTLVNSISDRGEISIGSGTVIEHCQVAGSLSVGSNSLVSGLRGRWNDNVIIQDNFVCQLIKLRPDWRNILNVAGGDTDESFVCIFHHINDSIKAHDTCYGVPIHELLLKTGLKVDDLWDENDKRRLLWDAKINPVITKTSKKYFEWNVFSWINDINYVETSDNEYWKKSLDKWKYQHRISLSQLSSVVDASHECSYRSRCASEIAYEKKLQNALLTRSNEELCLTTDRVNEIALLSLLQALDHVIMASIENDSIDISSRAFMLLGKILADYSEFHEEANPSTTEFKIDQYLDDLRSSKGDKKLAMGACTNILHHRDLLLAGKPNRNDLNVCSLAMEEVACTLTQFCVSSGIKVSHTQTPPDIGKWVHASAPARVDISGGWSDTPPLSYEHGGAVASLAVTINKKKPLSAKCRIIPDSSGILLCAESRDLHTEELNYSEKVIIESLKDLSDYNNPCASCALLKCALLVCGLVPIDALNADGETETNNLQSLIDKMCHSNGVGLELVTTSLLPQGSGMGSSSILAGCALASLCRCLGLSLNEEEEFNDGLTQGVLLLEQLLTTGGGWQDQVGGLYGGLKLGQSEINKIPMQVTINKVDLSQKVIDELNMRMVLIYTGQPRLAKNILRNVLRQWMSRKQLIVETVNNLVKEAHQSIEALRRGNFDELGNLISLYWRRKKIMAGTNSGVEPTIVKSMIDLLLDQKVISGASLCGAGGGGFLFLLMEEGKNSLDVKLCFEQYASRIDGKESLDAISWYDCNVNLDGVTITTDR